MTIRTKQGIRSSLPSGLDSDDPGGSASDAFVRVLAVSEIYQLPLDGRLGGPTMQFGMGPASGYDIRLFSRNDATSQVHVMVYFCIMVNTMRWNASRSSVFGEGQRATYEGVVVDR